VKSRNVEQFRNVDKVGKPGICTEFWWENILEIDNLEDQKGNGRITLRRMIGVLGCEQWR
jgi:hypothetical protein